jgi:hypothetical protein
LIRADGRSGRDRVLNRGTVGYLINLIAADSAHDKHKDQLLAILKTVVFKEGTPANGPEGIAPDVKK